VAEARGSTVGFSPGDLGGCHPADCTPIPGLSMPVCPMEFLFFAIRPRGNEASNATVLENRPIAEIAKILAPSPMAFQHLVISRANTDHLRNEENKSYCFSYLYLLFKRSIKESQSSMRILFSLRSSLILSTQLRS